MCGHLVDTHEMLACLLLGLIFTRPAAFVISNRVKDLPGQVKGRASTCIRSPSVHGSGVCKAAPFHSVPANAPGPGKRLMCSTSAHTCLPGAHIARAPTSYDVSLLRRRCCAHGSTPCCIVVKDAPCPAGPRCNCVGEADGFAVLGVFAWGAPVDAIPPVTVRTDHMPLTYLPSKEGLSGRQAPWVEFLLRFHLECVHEVLHHCNTPYKGRYRHHYHKIHHK